MTNGTVQKPLTSGEAFEFGAAVMQQLGRDIDPDKARYYIGHKAQLGKDLRKLGIHKILEFDAMIWEKFFKKHFGTEFDFSNLHMPQKPAYPCRAIVVPQGLTSNQIFAACAKAFKSRRYINDLDTVRDIVLRPAGNYVVRVRDIVEADEDMKNKSAEDIERAGTNTLTLKERMLLELVYFDETGGHLDIKNWTLCAGSRGPDGSVPGCFWSGGEFFVYWTDVARRVPRLRSRVAVS